VVEEAFTPILTARRPGAGWGDPDCSERSFTVSGAELSALTLRPDGLVELRLFNPTDQETVATVAGRRGQVTDLRGRPLGQPFDEAVNLRPHQIVTLALDHR
jgi:hypothetical protein